MQYLCYLTKSTGVMEGRGVLYETVNDGVFKAWLQDEAKTRQNRGKEAKEGHNGSWSNCSDVKQR